MRYAGAIILSCFAFLNALSTRSNANDFSFKTVKGRGRPVCDAYLSVLNSYKYDSIPFCQKFDLGREQGFDKIAGHFESGTEIMGLANEVYQFMHYGDAQRRSTFYHPNLEGHPELAFRDSNWETENEVDGLVRDSWLKVWISDEPVDFNNDGHGAPVLLWRGLGTTDLLAECGVMIVARNANFVHIGQRAFVLTQDKSRLDEKLTRETFGNDALDRYAIPSALHDSKSPFRPMGGSIDIFKFNGRTYVTTESIPLSKTSPYNVNVYFQEAHRRQNICGFSGVY